MFSKSRKSFTKTPSLTTRYDFALACLQRADKFLEEIGITRALEQCEYAIELLNRLVKSLVASTSNEKFVRQVKNTLAEAHIFKSNCYLQQGLARPALDQLNLAGCQLEELTKTYGRMEDYISLGELYSNMVVLYTQLGEKEFAAKVSANLYRLRAELYRTKARNILIDAPKGPQASKVMEYYCLAIEAFALVDKANMKEADCVALSETHFELAQLYLISDEEDKCLAQYKLSLAALKMIDKEKRTAENHRLQATYCNHIGDFYNVLGNAKAACRYYKNSIVNLLRVSEPDRKANDFKIIIKMYERVAAYYAMKGDVKERDRYLKNADNYAAKLEEFQSNRPPLYFFSIRESYRSVRETSFHAEDYSRNQSSKRSFSSN